MALRPWLRPSSTASRNGSHKLVDGTSEGDSCSEALNSTPNPVVTAFSLAGFAGGRRPHAPGGRTPIPAAFRYAPAVSRRTPVSCSMRRKGHPSRPRTMTCCFFASLKTLLIPTKATALRRNQRPRASFPLAGFEVTLIGRFWVTPEAEGRRCGNPEGASVFVLADPP